MLRQIAAAKRCGLTQVLGFTNGDSTAMRILLFAILFYTSALPAQNLPTLSPNAPQDKPIRWEPSEVSERDRQFQPYISMAQKTYPDAKKRYLAGLPDGEHFFVVTRLSEGTSTFEQTFIAVTKIEGGYIDGNIANKMDTLRTLKMGDHVRFSESKVLDWLITKPDGSEEGNFVGKFMDSQQ